jgi:hypothetical protein
VCGHPPSLLILNHGDLPRIGPHGAGIDRPLQTTLAAAVPLGDRETMLIPRTLVRSARVPMGFEQAGPLPPSNGPRTPQPLAGMTMRQVLELIVGLDPRYTWREVDGVAVVRPTA